MKKRIALLLAAVMTAASCGAGERPDSEPPSARSVAWYIVRTGCNKPLADLEPVHETRDAETVAYYLTEVYGLEEGSWSDAAIYRAGGTEAFEIAVIRTENEKTAQKAARALEDYIAVREGDFTGYEPEQAAIVHDAKAAFSEQGDAALLICQDPDAAAAAFSRSYEAMTRVPFDPPGKDDMTLYDTAAILDAWDSGNASGLSEKDAAIFELASQVLDEALTPDMTDYEKERALYQWVTGHGEYDQDHYDKLGKMDPDSYNPYGLLHNGKAVCLGFATTFQLLMDMAGVECVTVVGASRGSTADHAWNMVRLDGKWYCADTTWDVGEPPESWSYFNVTSNWMTLTDHQWDYENVPEATAEDGGVSGS